MPGKYNAATAASATEDQADGEDSAAAETPKRTKKPAGKKSSAKKRRITDVEEGEEDASPVQGEASVSCPYTPNRKPAN